MDSLRYWVIECHVDGFRFDLASALARGLYDVDRLHSFFDTIHQDPVLSQVKLIAEPWDVGPGGYQVGNFPVLWSEWNGIYRDVVRDFWRGEEGRRRLRRRFTGSSDLYRDDGRQPSASINFITAHDGFTLHDLVTYNEKPNEANQEDNQDGTDDNRSWNHGVEGEPTTPRSPSCARASSATSSRRWSSRRACDAAGRRRVHRSQGGSNNAWCQDNEISWFHWEHWTEGQVEQIEFAPPRARRAPRAPVFRRQRFWRAATSPARAARRVVVPARRAQDDPEGLGAARRPHPRRVPQRRRDPRRDAHGERITDDSFLLLFNAWHEEMDSRCPVRRFGRRGRTSSRPPTRRWRAARAGSRRARRST